MLKKTNKKILSKDMFNNAKKITKENIGYKMTVVKSFAQHIADMKNSAHPLQDLCNDAHDLCICSGKAISGENKISNVLVCLVLVNISSQQLSMVKSRLSVNLTTLFSSSNLNKTQCTYFCR